MNRYNAKEFLPLVQALADGKTIQWGSNGKWFDHEDVIFSDELSSYRIKPKPKLRAWKPEEVPVGALVKNFCSVRWVIVHNNCSGGGFSILERIVSLGEAVEYWQYSTDGGITWQPCGVEE